MSNQAVKADVTRKGKSVALEGIRKLKGTQTETLKLKEKANRWYVKKIYRLEALRGDSP